MDGALKQLISCAVGEGVSVWNVLAKRAGTSGLYPLLFDLGWNLDPLASSELEALDASLSATLEALVAAEALTRDSSTAEPIVTAVREAIAEGIGRLSEIGVTREAPEGTPLTAEVRLALASDLMEWMLLGYLRRAWPLVFECGVALRAIAIAPAPLLYARGGDAPADEDDVLLRAGAFRLEFRASRFAELLMGPLALLERLTQDVAQAAAGPRTSEAFLEALGTALGRELESALRAIEGDVTRRAYVRLDPLGIEVTPPFLALAAAGPVEVPVPLPPGVERLTLAVVREGHVRLEWPGLLAVTPTGDTTLFDVAGFSLMLAGGSDQNALVLASAPGGARCEARARLAFRVPLEMLAGVDGGSLRAEGGATLTYRADEGARLALEPFVLSARGVRLGGASGLLLEEARLELGAVQFPLPALSVARPLPFDVTVRGRLRVDALVIDIEAVYSDGGFRLRSSGSVVLNNGVQLAPVRGKPVLEANLVLGAGHVAFAAAGGVRLPCDGGASELEVGGELALAISGGRATIENFAMSARAEAWRLSSELTLRKLSFSLGYRSARFMARLAGAIPFSDGFELELLDTLPTELAVPAGEAGLVIEHVVTAAAPERLDVRVTGGLRLCVPSSLMCGADGDGPVTLEAAGTFAFSTDPTRQPSLSGVSFAMRAERVHLGGPGGLIVEEPAVLATSVERLLSLGSAPHPTLTLSGKVICPVDAPTGEVALQLEGARFIFESRERPPRFEFERGGALGFEAAHVGGLPLEFAGAVGFKLGALPLPELLHPDNLILDVSAGLRIQLSDSAAVMGKIERVRVELRNGRPRLTLDGASVGVEGLSLPPLLLTGALGFHNLQDPLNIQLEGVLGGSMNGTGVKALVAIVFENGIPRPLGVCLDASMAGGISLAYGFVVVGAAGGISFANSNGDPCDFQTYTRARAPRGKGRRGVGRQHAAARPIRTEGCPCDCPPASLNILCQPHPDQDRYPGRAILKLSSLDEGAWSRLPLPTTSGAVTTLGQWLGDLDRTLAARVAAATAPFDPAEQASQIASVVVDSGRALIEQLIPVLNPEEVAPAPPAALRAAQERLRGVFEEPARHWAERASVELRTELEVGLRSLLARAESPPSLYGIVADVLYRGANCPDATLQVTGTFSYVGVALFLSVTGGVNVSTSGSIGVVGALNVLGVPLGQLRAFVTVTSEEGDPEPSLCGDLRFEFGPLSLGQVNLVYRCPGCITNPVNQLARHACTLAPELLDRLVTRIETPESRFAVRAGFDLVARPERSLGMLSAREGSALLAALLAELPNLAPVDAVRALECVKSITSELWSGFNPEIRLCGKVAPKLFGLPLAGELVSVTGLVQKSHIELGFAFSPMYLLRIVLPLADVFAGADSARIGVALPFPRLEDVIVDGLQGQYTTREQLEQYLNAGLERQLEQATYTFSYQFSPLGMKVAQGQGRALMPYLTPHPDSATSGWKNPDVAGSGRLRRCAMLAAALERGRLADTHWHGALGDILELPPGKKDLELRRDYFPHGGLIGAGRLQIPRLLWDAPPLELLARIASGTDVLDRLRGALELVRDYVLATRDAGTLAFYVPAPTPPGPLRESPGDNLGKTIDALLEFDAGRLTPGAGVELNDVYRLDLAFFEGTLKGRLLGVDIGSAAVYFVPPSEPGGASELRARAEISSEAAVRRWVKEAKLELVLSTPSSDRALAPLERQPIEQTFSALLAQLEELVARPSAAGVAPLVVTPIRVGNAVAGKVALPPVAAFATAPAAAARPGVASNAAGRLLLDVAQALAGRLPKASLTGSCVLAIPADVASFIQVAAGSSTELHAYSPYYDPAAVGSSPEALARRNGGVCITTELIFRLGTLWELRSRAELSVQAPTTSARPARLRAQMTLANAANLSFSGAALSLPSASLGFDSDPEPGDPVLALQGQLPALRFGALCLEPLSGTALPVSLTASRANVGMRIDLLAPAMRLRLPMLSSRTPLELRPNAGQRDVVFSTTGSSATLAAPNGIQVLAPGGSTLLQLNGAGSGSIELDAAGNSTLRLAFAAGLECIVLPNDPLLACRFALARTLDVTLRSDGTVKVELELPPVSFEAGLFTMHGADGPTQSLSVRITEHGLALTAPARLTTRIPGGVSQTAVLDSLAFGTNFDFRGSGSGAVIDLPGSFRSSTGAFSFERSGTSVRMKVSDVELGLVALPSLRSRFDLELGGNALLAKGRVGPAAIATLGAHASVESSDWRLETTTFQSIQLRAKACKLRLFGSALALGGDGSIEFTLGKGGISAQVAATGSVALLPGLLELGVSQLTVRAGVTAELGVQGRLRALGLAGGKSFLVDTALALQITADHFETGVLASAVSLFSSNQLAVSADLRLGRDSSGFYVRLDPLRASYLGVALVQSSHQLRTNAPLTLSWSDSRSFSLTPFALDVPSGSVSLDFSARNASLSLGAGRLRTNSSTWPVGSGVTGAVRCNWVGGVVALATISVLLPGSEGKWQEDLPAVRYRVLSPQIRVGVSLGEADPAKIIASIALSGSSIAVESVARRPDNQPWASAQLGLPDTPIDHRAGINLALPPLPKLKDPLESQRKACENATRSEHPLPSLPTLPARPSPPSMPFGGSVPASMLDEFNRKMSEFDAAQKALREAEKALEKAQKELDKALEGCAKTWPKPPAVSFGGQPVALSIRTLFDLR